jgi:hypothetical protein
VQVVDALARALLLEDDAIAHLHRLARPVPGRTRRTGRSERVSPGLLRMMNDWHRTPAVILGRCMTVLACNPRTSVRSHMRPNVSGIPWSESSLWTTSA